MPPQTKNSDFGLCKYFWITSSLYKLVKFAEGSLYNANTVKLDYLVSSSIAQISKVSSAQ
jgi:hypothetical protein